MSPTINDLSAAKRLLLERRLRGTLCSEKQVSNEVIPLTNLAYPAVISLSYTQDRYLVLGKESPAAVQHARIFRFRGAVEPQRLSSAMKVIFNRHDIFRTRYPVIDGISVQEVLPAVLDDFPLQILDPEPLYTENRLKALARQAQVEMLDPALTPPCRVQLFQLGPEDHALLWHANHVMYDDWSLRLFFNEFMTLCQDQHLPPVSRQYRDYAAWWRHLMHSSEGDKLRWYWRETLDGCQPMLRLPERQSDIASIHAAAEASCHITPEQAVELMRLANREQSTMFVVVLDALARTLASWTAQDDLVVGATVADRSDPATQLIMGPLINWVPIRLSLGSASGVNTGREQTKKAVFGALAHHRCPLEEMGINVPDNSQNRLVQQYNVKLTVRHAPKSQQTGTGLSYESIGVRDLSTRYDLEFFLDLPADAAAEGARLRCVYNADDLFRNTIETLLAETGARLCAAASVPSFTPSMETMS